MRCQWFKKTDNRTPLSSCDETEILPAGQASGPHNADPVQVRRNWSDVQSADMGSRLLPLPLRSGFCQPLDLLSQVSNLLHPIGCQESLEKMLLFTSALTLCHCREIASRLAKSCGRSRSALTSLASLAKIADSHPAVDT